MNVYKTDLVITDFDLKNQLLLEAEAKYALATEHTHILDSNDMLFKITEKGNEIILYEISFSCAGELQSDDCDDCEEPVDPIEVIIDSIIRNSLLSSEPIRKEQAETMLILAHLKSTLSSI